MMKRLYLLTIFLTLSGCDSGSNNTKTPEEIQKEVAQSQRLFKENQRRIEDENNAREMQLTEQRSYIRVQFVSVDEEFLDVELTNKTTKDIDNIVGSLVVFDGSGNSVTSVALTNWVPGDTYLSVGGTTPARKSLTLESPEKRSEILKQASEYTYFYTVLRIQFVGEDEINYMEPALQTEQAVVMENKPVNQVAPVDCASNQISLETEQIYYPGPECEHIGRNIDAERFKLEYINMCKSKLGITEHLSSVAKVQVSSCIYESNRPGLTFRKRICCDRLE